MEKRFMAKDLENLYLSTIQFLIPLTAEETYIRVVEEAKKLTGASYGTILLMQKGELKRVYTSLPMSLKTTFRSRGFSYSAFSTNEPRVISAKYILPHHEELRKIGLRASLMIPLSYYHHTLGVLVMAVTKKYRITQKKLQLFKLFGAMTSLSIRKTQLYSEAKDALTSRDLFLEIASHELRTPLTAINAYAHLLQKRFQSMSGPEVKWSQELYEETKLLTRMVNELLNVNLIQSGTFSYNKHIVDIEDVLSRVVKQFSISYPYHNIIFTNKIKIGKPIVEADADRLVQMLQNILENAAKFSQKESGILLTLFLKKSSVIISIQDSGNGIAKKDIPKLSSMFYKEKGNYKDGMGLGLYISKMIIDEHHGTIAIDSGKKKGTTVTITLPKLRL